MLFNSLTFCLFFAVVFACYLLLRDWRQRKGLLLAASYIFYAAWNPPYVAILAFSTVLDWWLARRIDASANESQRRALLVLSLVSNLSLLGFFKYGVFLLSNFQALAHALRFDYVPPGWSIVLPIGISFYTFASLSYTIDVYRREIRADCGLLDYALFVSLFPHLVAGPIVRARQLLPQIATPRRTTASQIGWGIALFCVGLFCKTVLADTVFAPVVDEVYHNPSGRGAMDSWGAVLGFSGQIYYDFAGYSLCAIGLALCFGFEFPDNFRYPYAARGFSDFWRRWHITLSTWLRDYLYIPLGGSRGGEARTIFSLVITMLLGGLWHGASWMFVLWGALHGLYLVFERHIRRSLPATLAPDSHAALPWYTLATFAVVTLTWIPFRAMDLATASAVCHGLIRFDIPNRVLPKPLTTCFLTMAATVLWQFKQRDRSLEAWLVGLGTGARTALLTACLIAIYLCSGGDQRAFIYFQF